MPWCPKCKNEYKEGFKTCSDCGSELVESLEEDERVSIMSGEEEQIELLRKFLEYNDIMSCLITQMPEGVEGYTYELSVASEDAALAKRAAVVFIRETSSNNEDELTTEGDAEAETENNTTGEETHIFIKAEEKAESFKSSAYALTIVGAVGLIVMILIMTGIIPFSFSENVKIIAYIVLTLMFAVFIAMGIHSMLSAKKYTKEAGMENSKTSEILEWFAATYKADDIDGRTEDIEGAEELKYFKRTEVMKTLIRTPYPELPDAYIDHLIDELYQGIFES